MSGSQSLQDQTGSALSEAVNTGSPRPEMPRQNSDPMSETPGPPLCIAGREERDRERDRDRDRTAWLREEDIPPKVRVRDWSLMCWLWASVLKMNSIFMPYSLCSLLPLCFNFSLIRLWIIFQDRTGLWILFLIWFAAKWLVWYMAHCPQSTSVTEQMLKPQEVVQGCKV